MADIELVIKIPKEVYEDIKDSNIIFRDDERTCYEAVQNGTPLPKGHGDLIDRNEAIKSLFDYFNGKTIGQCIDDTPTIIEADKE